MKRWSFWRAGHSNVILWGVRADHKEINLWLPFRVWLTYRRGSLEDE